MSIYESPPGWDDAAGDLLIRALQAVNHGEATIALRRVEEVQTILADYLDSAPRQRVVHEGGCDGTGECLCPSVGWMP